MVNKISLILYKILEYVYVGNGSNLLGSRGWFIILKIDKSIDFKFYYTSG